MKLGVITVAATLSLATAGSALAAPPPPARVVVAGPADDVIAARVEKELVALGFETIRVGGLDSCARSAVAVAVTDSSAVAAACSDGDQVGIWVSDGGTLRLRDVVVAREEGERGRETTAVRAAEATRTTIAMVEEEAARSPKPAPPPAQPAGWETFDRPPPALAPPKQLSHRAPALLGSAGVSTLMGADASAAAFSTQLEIGVLRNMTATARLDYPIEKSDVDRSSLRVAPAFAGAGVSFPFTAPSSLFIPRAGAGVGLVWINAVKNATQTFGPQGIIVVASTEGSDSIASAAGYVSFGLSMRVVGPLRFTVDGLLGTTTSRLVVREQGVHMAYWGQPFGTLAMRAELMFQ